jgi:hypothetical protein
MDMWQELKETETGNMKQTQDKKKEPTTIIL